MGFIQLLASLWPFLKEMFVGEKIKDSADSKESAAKAPGRRRSEFATTAAQWCIDKMQTSRRFLATVLTLLILSLFINYKAIGKLAAVIPPRNEEHVPADAPQTKEQKELPTIPRPDNSERDVLYDQTVRELKSLYGGHR